MHREAFIGKLVSLLLIFAIVASLLAGLKSRLSATYCTQACMPSHAERNCRSIISDEKKKKKRFGTVGNETMTGEA